MPAFSFINIQSEHKALFRNGLMGFMDKKISVLFVCMGNICRSPTAEGVFRARVVDAGVEDLFVIDSAGTHAYHIGEQPDQRSQVFAKKRGIDLSNQRARQVRAEDFSHFDIILAADQSNLALLKKTCPAQYQHKLGLMMDFARNTKAKDVPDPYYGGAGGFDLVLDYLEDAAEGLLSEIKVKYFPA